MNVPPEMAGIEQQPPIDPNRGMPTMPPLTAPDGKQYPPPANVLPPPKSNAEAQPGQWYTVYGKKGEPLTALWDGKHFILLDEFK